MISAGLRHFPSSCFDFYLRLRALYFDLIRRRRCKEPAKVHALNHRLETLGFADQAFADLYQLATGPRLGLVTGFAGWRTALWACRSVAPALDPVELDRMLRRALACPLPCEIHFELRLLDILFRLKYCRSESLARYALRCASRYRIRATDFLFALLLLQDDERKKLSIMRLIYQRDSLPPPQLLPATGDVPLFDRLHLPPVASSALPATSSPLVSVIIACFNSADTIETALRSLQQQTWPNIEVIIVDDCSTDQTVSVVTKYISDRVRLICMPVNSGAYVARNAALEICTGEFVTLHDADDWSHPAKIAMQASFLQVHPECAACTTRRVRISEDLTHVRLSSRGWILGLNTSSLMVRKDLLVNLFRGWDVVRFAADTELLKRIQVQLGRDAIKHLPSAPLTLQRLTSDSASSMSNTGYHGFTFGTRHIYAKSYEYWHRYRLPPFPAAPTQSRRPFLTPRLMGPGRERGCHYSVILASEFRMKGGSTRSSIEELKAQQLHGIPSAIVPMYRYDLNPSISEVEMLYANLDPSVIQFLAYGEEASCDLLIIRYPPVLRYPQQYLPQIHAKHVVVIVNQPPRSDYGPNGLKRYDLPSANANVINWLGVEPVWYPIGPLVRDALHRYHGDDLPSIRLAASDWTNILDLSTWRLRSDAPCLLRPGGPIRLGRHSRDESLKWIEDPQALLLAYPSSEDFEISVLGGARSVTRMLGGSLPCNWVVHLFGSLDPRDFLETLDFFVYYTHSSWIESFGRVIIEAMAIGVPVILPFQYRQLFADAAIYAEPAAVEGLMRSLASDPQAYRDQVLKARLFVEKHFGHDAHLSRLESYDIHGCR